MAGNRRVRVHWGDVSIVRATLNLIEAAAEAPESFNRYVLLSGADYPVQTNARIREVLASDHEFINIWNAAKAGSMEAPFVSDYHLMGFSFWNPRKPTYDRVDQRILRRIWQSCTSLLPPRRLRVEGIPLVQGSQWWALTDHCIAYLRDFHRQHPRYLRHFRYTAASDEFFFHSIIAASPFAEKITARLPGEGSEDLRHGIHYIDWRGRSRGAWSPRVLRKPDLPAIDASGALFARKFDEKRSSTLLDVLDSRIANRRQAASSAL